MSKCGDVLGLDAFTIITGTGIGFDTSDCAGGWGGYCTLIPRMFKSRYILSIAACAILTSTGVSLGAIFGAGWFLSYYTLIPRMPESGNNLSLSSRIISAVRN